MDENSIRNIVREVLQEVAGAGSVTAAAPAPVSTGAGQGIFKTVDEAVAAAKVLDKLGYVAPPSRGQSCHLQTGDPALGAFFQRAHVPRREF